MPNLDVNVFGSYDSRDLPTIHVADTNLSEIYDQMIAFAQAESQFLSEMTSLLADESDVVTESFGEAFGGDFQDLGEIGTVEGRRFGGKYQLGYPIYAKGDRFIYTKAWLDEATLADLNGHVVNTALADTRGFIRSLNQAIMIKDNYTFDDDQWPGRRTGLVSVKRLANADSGTGYVYTDNREIGLGSLNHYLISGNGSLNEAAFTLIRDALRNVGNDSDIVVLASRATCDAAEALTNFVKRQDVNIVDPNAKYALVSSPRARGRIANSEVWEWPHFPDGYLFGFDRTKPKPGRVRVHHLSQYRGLQLATPDGQGEIAGKPMVNKRWLRIYGCGVQNRTNGVAVKIAASGSYINPTF